MSTYELYILYISEKYDEQYNMDLNIVSVLIIKETFPNDLKILWQKRDLDDILGVFTMQIRKLRIIYAVLVLTFALGGKICICVFQNTICISAEPDVTVYGKKTPSLFHNIKLSHV